MTNKVCCNCKYSHTIIGLCLSYYRCTAKELPIYNDNNELIREGLIRGWESCQTFTSKK